jgi:hypothetical protein
MFTVGDGRRNPGHGHRAPLRSIRPDRKAPAALRSAGRDRDTRDYRRAGRVVGPATLPDTSPFVRGLGYDEVPAQSRSPRLKHGPDRNHLIFDHAEQTDRGAGKRVTRTTIRIVATPTTPRSVEQAPVR